MATVQMFMELQVLLTLFLVTLFRFLQDRLPHREFFRLWTWAWTWFGIFLAVGRLSFHMGPEWTLAKAAVVLISTLAGFLQVPLFFLGALSLRRKIRRKWLMFGVVLSLLVGTACFTFSLLAASPLEAYALRSVPRQALLALACFSGTVVLWNWRQRRSRGVVVTALSCFLGGMLYLMNALRVANPFLGGSGAISQILTPFAFAEVRWFYLDVIWQCGIALGMILFLLEDYSRAESALRQSERKFSKAFHSSPDIIVISDAATSRLIEVNDSFVRITGHERHQVVGRSAPDLTLWNDATGRDRLLALLRSSGQVRDFELHFRTRSGEVRVGLVSAETIQLDGRECILHVVRDITDRKRVEEALRSIAQGTAAAASRDFFASLVRHLASALQVRYAFVTECTDTTRSRLRTLAFWSGDSLAANVEYPVAGGPCEAVALGEAALHLRDLCDLFPEDVALRRLHAESYAGIPLLDSSGNVIGHLAVMHDQPMAPSAVSMQILQIFAGRAGVEVERERAMRALRASQERYRDLVENANDVIYSHDLEGKVTSLNTRGEQMLGCPREEILGKDVRELVAPEHVERVEATLGQIRDGKDAALDLEVVARSGSRMWLEINARPILTDGEPVGVQGIARDITDRKHLEDQLRQAQKMEAVGQLAGGVAHDFNNLLMVISGYGDLLLDWLDADHPARRHAEQIMKAADRASSLTRQLLAFSRKQVLQPRVLDLNHLVLELGKMLPRVIREDIALSILPGSNIGHVLADPNQIEQVIMNLVVNARDAMPRGGKLTIETENIHFSEDQPMRHASMPAGGYVLLAVSDTGIGMDAATQRRIFEPFFTTKEQGKGTGLGLATAYGIVKQSGGFIWVYSEPGQGATFKIYLPRVSGPVAVEPRVIEEKTYHGTETVLLVEDEDDVRLLTSEFLKGAGYQVVEARDPTEAIARSAQMEGDLHLIITDVVMPGMSGPELVNHLLIQHRDARVLYVSGYAEEAIVNHGILDRGAILVDKPFNRLTLIQRVRGLLDGAFAEEDTSIFRADKLPEST